MAEQTGEDRQYHDIAPDNPVTKFIASAQIVEIEIKLGLFAGQYKSRVLDFGDKFIKLMVPKVDNHEKEIWKETTVHINYMRPDAMYTFKSRVRRCEVYPRPLLQIDIPTRIERVQRRRYVRVDTPGLMVKFRRFNEEVPYDQNSEPFRMARMVNISAGGMRLDNDEFKVEKGELIEVEFLLEGYKFQHVIGELVRSLELTKRDAQKNEKVFFSFGINFIQIHRVMKEKIFNFVFKKEREMLGGAKPS